MNRLIEEETSLSAVITTLSFSNAFLICSYKMLYYLITKQILYALYKQLCSLPESQKQAFGLHSYKYSINDTILAFSFWGTSRKRPLPENDSDPNRIELRIQERDGFMGIFGKCNNREFSVDLREYRVMQIVHDVTPLRSLHRSASTTARASCWRSCAGTSRRRWSHRTRRSSNIPPTPFSRSWSCISA